MLDFKVIELSDKAWIDELLSYSDFRGCEYCFANNMAWRRMADTKIARYKDFYISCSFRDGIYFTFPAGRGDYAEVFSQMKRFSEENNQPLTIGSVLPEQFGIFSELYPDGAYEITPDEDGRDYVYNSSDLAQLAGKKYHSKRNHLKKILDRNYSYKPLDENDFDECITYAVNTYNRDSSYDVQSKVYEQFAINTYFENFYELGLRGGVLRVDGRIAAFTLGEPINSDTFGVHIEKADADMVGAYAAINNFFAKSAAEDHRYLNREEDLGVEGLRKAKRSYHPAFMIEKHIVTFK